MLIVTDERKLPEYGFRKNGFDNHAGRDIWVLDIEDNEEDEITLIVNPLQFHGVPETKGEVILTLNIEASKADHGREYDLPLDVIGEMIADGVIKVVRKKEVAA